MAGATYDQIAQAVGYRNKGNAHAAVTRALAINAGAVAEQREEYRNLMLARCERLIRSLWTDAVRTETPSYERVQLVREVRALLEREAKLLGADAPAQVVVTEVTTSALMEMLDDMERLDQTRVIESVAVELTPDGGLVADSGLLDIDLGGNGDEPGL